MRQSLPLILPRASVVQTPAAATYWMLCQDLAAIARETVCQGAHRPGEAGTTAVCGGASHPEAAEPRPVPPAARVGAHPPLTRARVATPGLRAGAPELGTL